MITFLVTVRTVAGSVSYDAIARHGADLIDAAVDRFGICSVFVEAKHV
jgi:dihydrodipicolinate synthase/N-acetylneuraminate lyase